MIPPKYKPKQTVYFKENDSIQSGHVIVVGKDKEQFKDYQDNHIGQVLTNNIYFIQGFPGRRFKETELSDSPEMFL